MRIIITALAWVLLLSSCSLAQLGVALNYKIKGESDNQTTMRGKFRAIFSPRMKRITGFIYFQEAGNPFPDSDDKDVIVDFSQNSKDIFTSESRSWLSTSLEDEYALISKGSIRVSSVKVKNQVKTTVYLNRKPSMGGRQKYTVTYTYADMKPEKEGLELQKYKRPTAADLLTILIENEKIVDEVSKKSLIKKYGIPDSIHIQLQEKGKTVLDATATIKTKSVIRLPDDAYGGQTF